MFTWFLNFQLHFNLQSTSSLTRWFYSQLILFPKVNLLCFSHLNKHLIVIKIIALNSLSAIHLAFKFIGIAFITESFRSICKSSKLSKYNSALNLTKPSVLQVTGCIYDTLSVANCGRLPVVGEYSDLSNEITTQ